MVDCPFSVSSEQEKMVGCSFSVPSGEGKKLVVYQFLRNRDRRFIIHSLFYWSRDRIILTLLRQDRRRRLVVLSLPYEGRNRRFIVLYLFYEDRRRRWVILSLLHGYEGRSWHFFLCSTRGGARIACWLERRTHDRKVVSLNPGRSGGRIFFSRVNFVCWLLFSVRSNPVLQQKYTEDRGHSAKNAGGRLHLNMHSLLINKVRLG